MAVTTRRVRIALTVALIAMAALAPSAAPPLSFDGGRLVDSGTREVGLAFGDFNEDGYPDVVTANSNGTADLLINRTDNWFFMAPGWPKSATGANENVVVGDFNNDDHLDAALVARDNGLIRIFLGDGTGGIISSLPYSAGAGNQPFDVAAADVNGDSYLDIVTANQANTVPAEAPTVTVRLNNGSGGFAAGGTYTVGAVGALARGVALGDVTGDNETDIVVVNSNAEQVRILTGDGTGAFTLSPTAYATARGPRKVVLADFDEDGDLDIATADSGDAVPAIPANRDNRTTVLLNDGAGVFTAAAGSPFTTGPAQSSPFALQAHDLDGDGHLDLAFVHRYGGFLSVLSGAGDGSFRAYQSVPYPDDYTDAEATDIAVGDVNHDGKPDLLANAAGSPGYLVPFLNTTIIDPPVILSTQFSPSNVPATFVTGTAQDGSTIKLYTTSDCSGAPIVTGATDILTEDGTAAYFVIGTVVPQNSTTTFYGTATNAAGWSTSACSSTSASFTHDGIPPAAPTIAIEPASPSTDTTPTLLGSAEAGSTISIYSLANCAGLPVLTGSAADYASPGLTVSVPYPSSTSFSVTATDAAGNTSACSESRAYDACLVNPSVNTLSDSVSFAPGRLRDAVAVACAGSTITFEVAGTIQLENGPIELRAATIDGANQVAVSQGVQNQPVFISRAASNSTLHGLTIRDARNSSGDGGGIFVEGGALVVSNSWITNNEAFGGGGMEIRGGTVLVRGSTISGNTAWRGGGIRRMGISGLLTIENTTISGNSAEEDGGGLYNFAGTRLISSTVTNNTSAPAGITGGGISAPVAMLLQNTIVAGNTGSGGDMIGTFDEVTAGGSTFNVIGNGTYVGGITHGTRGNLMGTPASPIDARLGPLASNGGPTQTHALLTGSPALDAGDGAITSGTDQRGLPRVLDGPDADTTQTMDIGAVEQIPSIEDIADRTIFEDTPLAFTINLGDPSGGDLPGDFESVVATSNNQALVTNANLTVTGSGSTRTLSIATEPNAFGAATITVTVQKDVDGDSYYATDTFVLTVSNVNDAPTLAVIPNPAAVAEDSGSHSVSLSGITAGPGGELQALTVTATSSDPSIVPDPIVSYSSPGATGSLSFTPAANKFGTVTITVTVQDAGGIADGGIDSLSRTFDITVTPVADTPNVTAAFAFVNTPTTSGLVITRNAVDGAEVQAFKITNIQNGTLTLAGTSTPVVNGDVLSPLQGLGGLSFTPALDSTATGSVSVTAQLNAAGDGASAPVTRTIPVSKYSTETSVSTAPNPSEPSAPVTVSVTVASTNGGPTPMGSISVTIAGSTDSCGAPLIGGSGSCQLTLADAGTDREVTAVFPGDAASIGSVGTTFHTVTACPQNPVVVNTDDSGPGSLRQAIADACSTDTITFAIPGSGPHTITLLGGNPLNLSKNLTITGPTNAAVAISGNSLARIAAVGIGANVTIENLTLKDGISPSGGGAILSSGNLTIRSSTLSGNQAAANGGAIEAFGGSVTIYNSTLSGNSAASYGAAIWSIPSVTLVNATVTANTGLDTIFWAGSLTAENSIVAGNTAQDLSTSSSGTLIDLGHNLLGVDAKLGPLQDNGGPTFTHALVANSPALDAGDDAAAVAAGIATDQRGVTRSFDGPDADSTPTIDIGAFEARASVALIDTVTQLEGTTASVTVHVGDAVTQVQVTSTVGPLFLPQPPFLSVSGSGSTWTVFMAPQPDFFGTQTVQVFVTAGPETLTVPLTLNVLPVADTPSITDAVTDEDVPTTSGLVVTKANVDGLEVTHLKIVSVTNGTLYKNDGVTPLSPGTFALFADGEAGFKFTPAPNTNDTGLVTVQASIGASDAGLGGAPVTASIFISAIADPPQVSSVTTLEDTQSGLIFVLPNPVDAPGPTIRAFEITNITGGRLYRADGAEISDGHVISTAQGAAGLRFTPSLNSLVAGHFTVRAGFSPGSMGGVGTMATITVTPVADTPSVTPATTYAERQTTSGLQIQLNAVDGAEVTYFKIGAPTTGTLFQNDGTTPIAAGEFITIAQGAAGLKFTPAPGFVGSSSFLVEAATDATGTGLSPAATTTIIVAKHLTATTITSYTPNPIDNGAPLLVTYSVASTTGGPTPTGTVTVTVDTRSCTGTVQAGQCVLNPNTAGAGQTLTAIYSGDAVSDVSFMSVLLDVNVCPTNRVVTTTDDSGPGSLRQAILDSCSSDAVTFDIPGPGPHTIGLTSGPLAVDKVIAFNGPMTERVRISGNHASRVFEVTSAEASFDGLEIVDGAADEGAGIRSTGALTLRRTTVSGNVAIVQGGGIFASEAPSVEIVSSTFSGNSAPWGSAIWVGDGPTNISSSTVTANTGGAAVVSTGFGPTVFFAELTNSIIVGNTPDNRAGAFSDHGGNLLSGNAALGPLQDNGGPTFTHMPLPNSPALDAGVNGLVTEATDQRGFARIVDGPDADQTARVDIGAVEAIPSVSNIAGTGINEDIPRARDFRLGTIAEPFTSIVATSSNQTLIPDTNLVITGSGDTRTLTITPAANRSGTATITIAATAQVQNVATGVTGPLTATSSFSAVVSARPDTPSVTNASTTANQQTTSGLVITRNAVDGAEVTHYQITAITGGALFQHDGVTPIANDEFITVAQGAAGLRFTPALGSIATGHFSVRASIGNEFATSALVTANITVGQGTTSVAVTTSGSPSVLGGNVTFTATVTPGASTGTVQFMDGASELGAPVPMTGGVATFTTSSMELGSHAITAAYSGDDAYLPSTGTLAGGQEIVMSVRMVLTGVDAGSSPHVRRFTALDGAPPSSGALSSFFAFDPAFLGGVRVAEGDINGDGVADVIAGAGPGRTPDVRVFDGATGVRLDTIVAFEPEFRGGVFVAAGDVNGDGYIDIVAGSGEGRPGQIKVFSGRDRSVLANASVFGPAFTGGVRVAAGDVNGDGRADLVVGTGVGAAQITVLNGADLSVLHNFASYPGFIGGVFVAAGDVTGDGYADIVTGAGAGGGPHVKVFDGRTGAETHGFFAFDASFGHGVRVAAGDVTGDGRADIIVGAGPGSVAEVRVFDPVTTTLLSDFVAYTPAFTGGVFVATAVPVSHMAIDIPQPGAETGSAFTLAGWAFQEGAGIAGIDVTALPVGGGAAIPLGAATLGDPRPDIGAIYGEQYANAGFHLAVSGLAPGVYDLRVAARGAVSGVVNLVRTVRVTVGADPQPQLVIDLPSAGRLSSGDFAVAGWALTLGNPVPPGVDAVDVWAAPVGGAGAWRFLGAATLGLRRPDLAIAFGPQYATAGYSLAVTGLPAGTWDVQVFPRATGGGFGAARVVRVSVPGPGGSTGGSTRPIMTGADAGGAPHVKRFGGLDGGPPAVGALSSFFAFEPSFTGGVRVAEGDLNGDGVPDHIAGAGPGRAPEIRVIDGASGTSITSFDAFEPGFRGGVFVAAGDVNGDGNVDIIAGSGAGRRGEIKVFSGRDFTLLRHALVFDPSFTGGVHVAAGDVSGDGNADLVAGAGAGGAQVIVLDANDLSVLRTMIPYAAGFLGGAWVAAGDVTGDGFADVITGAGAGGGPHVKAFDGRTGVEVRSFFAYEPAFGGGVRVAAGDVTGDGVAEIITGSGPGRAGEARVFDGPTGALLSSTLAYVSPGGLFVATAPPINRMAIDTPAPGAIVPGSFNVAGWAFDENPANTGIDTIHAWALPVAGGTPTFAGVAVLGVPRPDVAAIYGAQYAQAGFYVEIAGLAPGVYDLVLFGHSTVSATFNVQRVVRVTIAP